MRTPHKKRLLSIWSFVGFILIIYGLVISANGIYYKFHPPIHTGLYYLNPTLWWGLILLMIGILFNWLDLRNSSHDKS